jgi:hypothetical protein
MNGIDRAWIIGNWSDDDPLVNAWIRVAKAHWVQVVRTANIADISERLNSGSLVLFRLPMDPDTDPSLNALIATSAMAILYVPEGAGTIAPRKAVELCRHNNVLTIVEQRPDLPLSRSRRLSQFYAGHNMYREIRVTPLNGKTSPEQCFLVSPSSRAGEEFQEAATAALEGRGLRIHDPRRPLDRIRSEEISGFIRDSDFIVADTRIPANGANGSVLFEIGLAIGQNKTALLATPAQADSRAAIELDGAEYLRYWNSLDLTMKLFWGLRWIR